MLKQHFSQKRNKRGFSLIELIVVIAIVGVMVMVAAPKFLGYTKDAQVTTMKSDAKILTDAAMLYSVEHNSAWPIGAEVVKSAELEAIIGDVTVYEISNALKPYVRKLKGNFSDYGLITTPGALEGVVVHLNGVEDDEENMWYSTEISLVLPSDGDTPEACGNDVYLATDADFEGDADGEFIYVGTETEVRIPHVIKGVPITSYAYMFSPWYGSTTAVTKVVSDNPDIIDMSLMFASSSALSLDLSCFDTSGVIYMLGMFGFSNVTSLDLSNWDTSNVTNMGSMFYNANTTELNLNGWDTSNVTCMFNMFAGSHITHLDLSHFNVSSVDDLSEMFNGSLAISINVDNWTFDSTNYFYRMFANTSATSISMNNWSNSWLSGINTTEMFMASTATTLDLSSFDLSGLWNSSNMFQNALATTGYARTAADATKLNASSGKPAALTFININASPTDALFSGTKNGEFQYIGSATEVTIPHIIKGVPVTSYRGMFSGTEVTKVVSDNPNITDMEEMFYNSKATTLDVSGLNTAKVTDMRSMFSNSKATTINMSGWDTSNVTLMSTMFSGSDATSLDLSSFDTSKVTSMDSMFQTSQAITLDLSGFDVSKVVSMCQMFNFSSATTINVSGWNTSSLVDMTSIFSGTKVTSLDLSHFNTSKVTSMMQAFSSSEVTTLNVGTWDTSLVTDMESMFYRFKGTTLDLRSFDTSRVSNTSNMFYASQATTGYARTQADANKFNASSNKPLALTFIVP